MEHDSGGPARAFVQADTGWAEAARQGPGAVGSGGERCGSAPEVCMSWQEDLESHIAMRAEMNERAGMDPVEARRAAERAFGNRGLIGEEVRAVSVPVWLEQLGQDLRYAARGYARSPGVTLLAIAALTVGIGTSTAVFSFVDRILLRPLPFANQYELVWFGMTAP